MKIVIIGTSGSGKTTLAKQVSSHFAIPHIELDQLYWEPHWKAPEPSKFRALVEEATQGEHWVACGNFGNTARDIIWPKVDMVIWLAYPLHKILFRATKRVFSDWIHGREHTQGCAVSPWRELIPIHNGLMLWILKSHWKYKKEYSSFQNTNPYNGTPIIPVCNKKDLSNIFQSLLTIEQRSN